MNEIGAREQSTFRRVLEVSTSVAMLVASVAVVWMVWARPAGPPVQVLNAQKTATGGPPGPALPSQPLALDADELASSASARVAMIIYSDFECPFCGRFARETLPTLKTQYVESGQLVLAFRHLALERHRLAIPAATAAECAGRQGHFGP